MAGPSSPRPNDNDCLCLPTASSPRTRGAEKESTDLRPSQRCPPYVTPSSISSFGRRLNGAHTAEDKSLKPMAQTDSAKVVLGCDTHQTAARDIVRRPKTTLMHELEGYMRCKDYSGVRGYAYKLSHLVALRRAKISASDPPSYRCPEERKHPRFPAPSSINTAPRAGSHWLSKQELLTDQPQAPSTRSSLYAVGPHAFGQFLSSPQLAICLAVSRLPLSVR